MARARGRRSDRLSLAPLAWVAIVAAALPLTSALSGQFLWTDTAEVLEGGIIRGPAGLLAAVPHGIDRQCYRPVEFLLHSTGYWVFGPSALAFRGMNLPMHAVNALSTMAIWTTLGVERRLGRDTALLFVAHPVAVTAVSWASDRTALRAFSSTLPKLRFARLHRSSGKPRTPRTKTPRCSPVTATDGRDWASQCKICRCIAPPKSHAPVRLPARTATACHASRTAIVRSARRASGITACWLGALPAGAGPIATPAHTV
jgi:hypothetical protein